MRKSFIIYLLLVGSIFTSCSSSKHLSQAKIQREQLSETFGFKLTKKDNLALYSAASQWLGTPYRYGGTTRKGVDCSGLVGQIYKQVYRVNLERSTGNIVQKNCSRVGKHGLKTGDLVFFNTSKKKKKGVNHVGLFLKNGYFVHASSSKGVIISNLKEEYYRKAWKQGGRVK